MSPRAAWRLEQLGFEQAWDYAGGKMDWLAHGLDYEGEADLVGRHLDESFVCGLDDRVGDVAEAAEAAHGRCVVTSAEGVVMATLDRHAMSDHRDRRVADVARYGPVTVRPSEERAGLQERMTASDVGWISVTDPGGRLLGIYVAR